MLPDYTDRGAIRFTLERCDLEMLLFNIAANLDPPFWLAIDSCVIAKYQGGDSNP